MDDLENWEDLANNYLFTKIGRLIPISKKELIND